MSYSMCPIALCQARNKYVILAVIIMSVQKYREVSLPLRIESWKEHHPHSKTEKNSANYKIITCFWTY